MALYREDSTGFLVEYASNPGAGYTAVSAMPTDTVANRVAWHRSLDTYGQTSAWHPSLQSAAEDPSPLAITMSLSQETHLVSADVNGTVTDAFLGASTTAKVYRGAVDVTTSESWSFAYSASFCTVTQSTNTFTVTAMSADTATVTITATRTGSPTQTKVFTLAKVRPGAMGLDGIRGSRQILVAGTSWSDQAAWQGIVAQTGTNPVPADMVTIADANSGFSQSKFYSSGGNGTTTWGTWNVVNSYINGNLLVTGTLGADKISTGTMNASTITLGSSSGVIQSSNFIAGTSGFRIRGSGDAEFQNATIRGVLNAYDLTSGFIPLARIQDATITSAKIASLDAGKITTGSLSADRIAAGTITATKLSFTPLQPGSAASDINNNLTTIDGSKISTGTLTANKIVAGSITADRLVVNGITTDRIGSNQITDFNMYPINFYSGGWSAAYYLSSLSGAKISVTACLTVNNYAGAVMTGTVWLVVNSVSVAFASVNFASANSGASSGFAIPYSFTTSGYDSFQIMYSTASGSHPGILGGIQVLVGKR